MPRPPKKIADVRSLASRDGWLCQLCGTAIDSVLSYPHPSCATVNLVVPPALGGLPLLDNTQLAHLSCSIRRSAFIQAQVMTPRQMQPAASCAACGGPIAPRPAHRYHLREPKYCSRVCAGRGNHAIAPNGAVGAPNGAGNIP